MPYHVCARQTDRHHQDQRINQFRRDRRRLRGSLREWQHNEIHDDPDQNPVNYRIDKHSGLQPGDRGICSKIKTYPAESYDMGSLPNFLIAFFGLWHASKSVSKGTREPAINFM
jgi:hypothetical protein